MRLFRRVTLGLVSLLLLVALIAYLFLWVWPVSANSYINKTSLQMLLDSPELLTSIGVIDNTPLDFHSGKLDSYTKESDEKQREFLRTAREGMDDYGPDGLVGQDLLSWQITAWFYDDLLRDADLQYSGYRVNQISGPLVDMPQFLTDSHIIKNENSVARYLQRLNEFGRVLDEVYVRVLDDQHNGVVPPDFVIQKALTGMRNFIEGGAVVNPLVTTLEEKLKNLDGLDEQREGELLAETSSVVTNIVVPGYQKMIALFEQLLQGANHDAGIWRIPNGNLVYEVALKSNTTTELSADQIHQLGLSEVAKIEQQMDTILNDEGLTTGTVVERVQQLMSDPEHQFPDSDEGREQMIGYLNELNDKLLAKAPEYFITIPPQKLDIKRVPIYSQDSAPGGYYQQPALDGSRPGQFYINLKNPADNPRWTLPTLMYHEGAPGHHFQISAAQLIEDVPFLRKMGLFSAFTEGWGLYAERIAANDMGMYAEDPLGDLGRLQAEMFRAVRLVVDTGMHAKKWSREKAIEYMMQRTGNTEAEVTREIERYVVWPGQATSYKVGQLALLRLRDKAEATQGNSFDLREFHELILLNGAMPLELLESAVDEWAQQP